MGGLGGAGYGRTNRTPRRCLVYAVTYPRSVIGIDEQRIQGIHDIVIQRPSPARFVGASLECRQPQSSRGHRGRTANLMDPWHRTQVTDTKMLKSSPEGGRRALLCGALFVAVPRKPIVSMTATDAIQSML